MVPTTVWFQQINYSEAVDGWICFFNNVGRHHLCNEWYVYGYAFVYKYYVVVRPP